MHNPWKGKKYNLSVTCDFIVSLLMASLDITFVGQVTKWKCNYTKGIISRMAVLLFKEVCLCVCVYVSVNIGGAGGGRLVIKTETMITSARNEVRKSSELVSNVYICLMAFSQ